MKKAVLFLLFIVALSGISCTDRDDNVETVDIRIKNVSSVTFDEVQVGGEEMIHENIAPDKFSEYLEYETAYRYAYIQIKSGAEVYTLQPFDFVGETPLAIGVYTYELDIDEEGNVLLNFVIDF
ncbi:hypothetical protein GGR42_001153 [Saonia flava]|uniref:DUF3244 domain-containing protein n=1 Tax=Saonia flava TaxID=523696 RepID=A0A846QRC1_9FLAO|nr:hypothetical protein [Saonia flava]NJB70691.1 hypothetical protein [Saonia flava]